MQIESLETRRLLSGYAFLASNFNQSSSWMAGDFNYDGLTNISDFSELVAQFNANEAAADVNGDSRVDLADFDHFCETAVDSVANSLIRNSAGPGDSDGNGRIDKFDIRALGASFNSHGDWQNGDFTMNRRVDIQDFALAAANVIAQS